MKTKLEMAHEYAIALINSDCEMQFDKFIRLCWNYADAMQAEADKRKKEEATQRRKAIREMINADNTFLEKEGQHFDDVEWQPDWGQAPDGYDWWAMDGFSGVANWYKSEPFLDDDDIDEWNVVLSIATYREAPSFGYTGDWRNSLRKRPQ